MSDTYSEYDDGNGHLDSVLQELRSLRVRVEALEKKIMHPGARSIDEPAAKILPSIGDIVNR